MKTAPHFYKLNLTEEQIKAFKSTYYLDWRLYEYFKIEGVKAYYAKEVTRAVKPFFWDDVEIPTEDVSAAEDQSLEGEHKYWNKYQKDLVDMYENGTLFDDAIFYNFADCIVIKFRDKDIYIDLDSITNGSEDDLKFLHSITTDITEEQKKKIIAEVNPREIEEFCKNHSEEEIEAKYAEEGFEDEFWS